MKNLSYEVEMRGFGGDEGPLGAKGAPIRTVEVPAEEVAEIRNSLNVLDLVFHYGQNDVQAVPGVRSVSVGDAIRFGGRLFFVEQVGFKESV